MHFARLEVHQVKIPFEVFRDQNVHWPLLHQLLDVEISPSFLLNVALRLTKKLNMLGFDKRVKKGSDTLLTLEDSRTRTKFLIQKISTCVTSLWVRRSTIQVLVHFGSRQIHQAKTQCSSKPTHTSSSSSTSQHSSCETSISKSVGSKIDNPSFGSFWRSADTSGKILSVSTARQAENFFQLSKFK